jgi:hypothetical protein
MDIWRISVLKNSPLDYIVRCMGPLRWDFPLPAVVVPLPARDRDGTVGFDMISGGSFLVNER